MPAFSRRSFLHASATAAVGVGVGHSLGWADDDGRPPVTRPRATSGDDHSEPDWDERLTVTVGPKNADLVGTSHKVLQAAVDYVARLGGGTVQILPGEYRLRNAVHLQSGVRLRGSGAESVLIKEPSHGTKLASDSAQSIGIRLGPLTRAITLEANQFAGLAKEVEQKAE